MISEKILKKIIFYQELLKEQVKIIYVKDYKTFSKEYGKILFSEALYKAKLKEITENQSFEKSFRSYADDIICNFFEQNNNVLGLEKILISLEMQEEYDHVKKLYKKELQEFYNINRLKADKLIYEAATRMNCNKMREISIINRLIERKLQRAIENYDQLDDLQLSYIASKISEIGNASNKIIDIYVDKKIKFSVNSEKLAEILMLLSEHKIPYQEKLKNNIEIVAANEFALQITIDTNKMSVCIEVNNKNLLCNISYILASAIKPPLITFRRVKKDRNYLLGLKNLPVEQINAAQLTE